MRVAGGDEAPGRCCRPFAVAILGGRGLSDQSGKGKEGVIRGYWGTFGVELRGGEWRMWVGMLRRAGQGGAAAVDE